MEQKETTKLSKNIITPTRTHGKRFIDRAMTNLEPAGRVFTVNKRLCMVLPEQQSI